MSGWDDASGKIDRLRKEESKGLSETVSSLQSIERDYGRVCGVRNLRKSLILS